MRRVVVLVAALVLLGGNGMAAVAAQEATPTASTLMGLGYPELQITVTDTAFEVSPSEVPAGLVTLVVNNTTNEEQSAVLIGPPEGMGMDEFTAMTQATPMADEAGFPSWFYDAKITGGPVVLPGQTAVAVVELSEGDWGVIGESNLPPAPVRVTSGGTPETMQSEPTADLTVTMQDFAFVGLPDRLPAGHQVWRIENAGPQPHMAIISTAPAGVTLSQIIDAFFGGPNATPPGISEADIRTVGGLEISSAGQTAWVELDLAPGSYLVGCYVPDKESGMPHFAMGMGQIITVA
ncbi:MAG: hypothetical protein QOG89_588 [Thermomicrobiales bacterium]|nr:hypothetical protein [Thermomicrobiales bacterium]